jgi:hypothetical protein
MVRHASRRGGFFHHQGCTGAHSIVWTGDTVSSIAELLTELSAIDSVDATRFPYADCKRLQNSDKRYAELVPDLDVYLADLAGHRSWGKRILRWSDAKIEEVLREVDKSFFGRLPIYARLESQITPTNTPDLFARLERSDRTRALLSELLTRLKNERAASASS